MKRAPFAIRNLSAWRCFHPWNCWTGCLTSPPCSTPDVSTRRAACPSNSWKDTWWFSSPTPLRSRCPAWGLTWHDPPLSSRAPEASRYSPSCASSVPCPTLWTRLHRGWKEAVSQTLNHRRRLASGDSLKSAVLVCRATLSCLSPEGFVLDLRCLPPSTCFCFVSVLDLVFTTRAVLSLIPFQLWCPTPLLTPWTAARSSRWGRSLTRRRRSFSSTWTSWERGDWKSSTRLRTSPSQVVNRRSRGTLNLICDK